TREAASEAIEISIGRGELDLAQNLLDRFRSIVSTRNYLAPHLARLEPKLRIARGDHDGVEEGYKRAAGLLRETESGFSLAVARVEHGEWLLGRGRGDEAAPLLDEARRIFERLGARPWLERIEASSPPAVEAARPAHGH